MKRTTVWKNLQTLCEGFEEAVTVPERYPIPILRVWLYGTVLTHMKDLWDCMLYIRKAVRIAEAIDSNPGIPSAIVPALEYTRSHRG